MGGAGSLGKCEEGRRGGGREGATAGNGAMTAVVVLGCPVLFWTTA